MACQSGGRAGGSRQAVRPRSGDSKRVRCVVLGLPGRWWRRQGLGRGRLPCERPERGRPTMAWCLWLRQGWLLQVVHEGTQSSQAGVQHQW